MLYLRKNDFIYGAILSALISNRYKTVLIDGDSDEKRVYKFTSDSEEDFYAYFKFSMIPKEAKKKKDISWQFTFNEEEVENIQSKLIYDKHLKLFLLCGKREYKDSEIAVLEPEEILDSLFDESDNKKSVTVRKEHCSNYYYVARKGKDDIKVPSNRIDNYGNKNRVATNE